MLFCVVVSLVQKNIDPVRGYVVVLFCVCVVFSFNNNNNNNINILYVSVQNYTGDRLNFGLAAEQAKSEGYKVEVGPSIYGGSLLCLNLMVG